MSSQLKADDVLPRPSAVELHKMLTIEQVAELTTLSPDSINRHHADTIVPKPIDQTKKDGLRNSRRLSETNFIISPNSANSHIPERNTLMRIDKPHTIDRDSKPSDQNENKCRYHSRNVTETNLISSPEPAFQPTK